MSYENLEKILNYKEGRVNWHTERRDCLVYLIAFREGETYIGSTTNVRRRFAQYVADLTHNRYPNTFLQEAFNEAEEFSVYCMEWVSERSITKTREQFFIDIASPSLNIRTAHAEGRNNRACCKVMTDEASNLKERIKMILKKKGMTAKELAFNIGISEGALSLSISGNPTLSRLQEIAGALGVEVGELFVTPETPLICPECGAKLKLVKYEEGAGVQKSPEMEE